MVFSSTVFLFVFLPLALLLYYVTPLNKRNVVLLLISLIFYLWSEMIYLLVMIVSIVINFTVGVCIERSKKNSTRKYILLFGVFLNLTLLLHYKYVNFIIENIIYFNVVTLPPIDSIHLPIGISFFTFQALSYIIDVYRKTVNAQKNILNLGLYISLFPQLIAGPIVRYHDVSQQIIQRNHDLALFASGLSRFIIGLGKKVLIANVLAEMADHIFKVPSSQLTIAEAWIGILCYTLQIYFDFSGYSDMAIGLGRMFGFKFLENFNYPYVARSLTDFWRRWHISLSRWFRDYLYIPLGGNRLGPIRTYFNLLIVFILCGLWHGASWNFLIWGLIHGTFLIIERLVDRFNIIKFKIPFVFFHIYVMTVVIFSWIFFRIEDFNRATHFITTLFTPSPMNDLFHPYILNMVDFHFLSVFIIAIIFSTPLFNKIKDFCDKQVLKSNSYALINHAFPLIKTLLLFVILLFSIFSLSSGTYNPFIYFRF